MIWIANIHWRDHNNCGLVFCGLLLSFMKDEKPQHSPKYELCHPHMWPPRTRMFKIEKKKITQKWINAEIKNRKAGEQKKILAQTAKQI